MSLESKILLPAEARSFTSGTRSRGVAIIATLLAALTFSGNVAASLIGDTVACATSSALWECSTPTAVVGGGIEFELLLPGRPDPKEFAVDIADESIDFDVTDGVGNISGLGPITLSSLDWVGTPGIITGFTFSTDITGMVDTRLSFTDHSFSADFDGLTTALGEFLHVDLQVSHRVAEPPIIGILGAGLIALWLPRRRRSA